MMYSWSRGMLSLGCDQVTITQILAIEKRRSWALRRRSWRVRCVHHGLRNFSTGGSTSAAVCSAATAGSPEEVTLSVRTFVAWSVRETLDGTIPRCALVVTRLSGSIRSSTATVMKQLRQRETRTSSLRRRRGSTSAVGTVVRRRVGWSFSPPVRHSATGCEARHSPRPPRSRPRLKSS